jgi:hypothetical protein
MHHQYVNREFGLVLLSMFVMLCLSFITETPMTLVVLAGGMAIIGILGWYYSGDLPSPWIVRLASTVMMALGIAFLIWYFTIGRTLLRPIIDMQSIFESINASINTPQSTK